MRVAGTPVRRAPHGPKAPGRVADVRRRNLAVILTHLDRYGQSTRAQLAADTGLTKATVSSLVADLIAAGLVSEAGLTRAGERGRPGTGVLLNPTGAALGMEINVDYLAVGVLSLAGELVFERRVERRNAGQEPALVLEALASLAVSAQEEAARAGLRVYAAGLAVPGLVDEERVSAAPNIGWKDVDLSPWVERLTGGADIPVTLINEANSAALGELWYGHGRSGDSDYLFVSGEVGVGGGIIIHSDLFAGPSGHAGEIGHVVVEPSGPDCSCGGAGCLEKYAGQQAILDAAGIGPGTPGKRMQLLLAGLEAGDAQSRAAVGRAGRYLGVAAVSAARILNVTRLVLGGHFVGLHPWLLPELQASLQRHAPGILSPDRVLVSELGPNAAVVGAAGQCLRRVLENAYELVPEDAAAAAPAGG